MKTNRTQILIAAAVVCASAALTPPIAAQTSQTPPVVVQAPPVAEEDKWSFDIAPYLWVAFVEVETSVPESPGSGAASDVERFDTSISGGFMMMAQARYRSFGVFVDFDWLRLDTEAINPGPLFSDVNLESDYIHTTAALTYTLPFHGKFHAEVVAGARIWYVGVDLETETGVLPGFETSKSVTWVQPLAGANLSYDLSRHWRLFARGTVGGLSDSDIQWDAFAGMGYSFCDWCTLALGYRYLHAEHDRNDNFTWNADAHGVLLGVDFKF